MNDSLGDRMKEYELAEAGRSAMRGLPVCIRLDGVKFSNWTKGLDRPFDEGFRALMTDVTHFLMRESGADVGYHQSDEITLIILPSRDNGLYGSRFQKLASILASKATIRFNQNVEKYIAKYAGRGTPAYFDCRVWCVPDLAEASNVLLWRELDATKNSVSQAAQTIYPHKALMGKSGSEKQEMLFQKGINWNDYPSYFKRGTYLARRVVNKRVDIGDLEKLPPKHRARTHPDEVPARSVIEVINIEPLRSYPIQDRINILFGGES